MSVYSALCPFVPVTQLTGTCCWPSRVLQILQLSKHYSMLSDNACVTFSGMQAAMVPTYYQKTSNSAVTVLQCSTYVVEGHLNPLTALNGTPGSSRAPCLVKTPSPPSCRYQKYQKCNPVITDGSAFWLYPESH